MPSNWSIEFKERGQFKNLAAYSKFLPQFQKFNINEMKRGFGGAVVLHVCRDNYDLVKYISPLISAE